MEPISIEDPVRDFLFEVLRTGLMLADLVGDLADMLPEDAYPGETEGDVVFDMMVGSVRPVAAAAGDGAVEAASGLIADCAERVLQDLRLAAEIGKRRERLKGGNAGDGAQN